MSRLRDLKDLLLSMLILSMVMARAHFHHEDGHAMVCVHPGGHARTSIIWSRTPTAGTSPHEPALGSDEV